MTDFLFPFLPFNHAGLDYWMKTDLSYDFEVERCQEPYIITIKFYLIKIFKLGNHEL